MSGNQGSYRVAVVGAGLIGRRRAETAAAHPRTRLVKVVDTVRERANEVAARHGGDAVADWHTVLEGDVDGVVVATPNGFLAEVGVAALDAGRDVLLEKPMGRNAEEANVLAEAARRSGRLLKVGFNHRYHPGLARLLEVVGRGDMGRVVHVRARYGHGARPGYADEWRGDPEMAGGGHLMDQGVHLTDLIHGVAGLPERAVAFLHTAVWPMEPLEDNAYGMFRYADGSVAQIQTGLTEWRNLFSFEVACETGSVAVEGLGGSYGVERFVQHLRNMAGGVPETVEEHFPGPDVSWGLEWEDFVQALDTGTPRHGGIEDGLAAMRMIDALYRSSGERRIVDV